MQPAIGRECLPGWLYFGPAWRKSTLLARFKWCASERGQARGVTVWHGVVGNGVDASARQAPVLRWCVLSSSNFLLCPHKRYAHTRLLLDGEESRILPPAASEVLLLTVMTLPSLLSVRQLESRVDTSSQCAPHFTM